MLWSEEYISGSGYTNAIAMLCYTSIPISCHITRYCTDNTQMLEAFPAIVLTIYLIKGPVIVETAIPHLVHYLCSLYIVFDAWPCHHAQCGAPTHAVLELFGDAPLVLRKELAGETAFAGEG